MMDRFKFLALGLLAVSLSGTLSAQGLRLSSGPVSLSSTDSGATAGKNTPIPSDFIVAVVNSEPITNAEVMREVQRIRAQLAQQQRPQPDLRLLGQDVLENLISIKAQLQSARENGLKVEESAIDLAEQNVALQNQFDVAELRRKLALDGVSVSLFRSQLQDQILLQRLREREVDARVRVSDLEIDQYLKEQKNNQDPGAIQINLAQILVAVPENATPVQVDALRKRADRAHERAKAGEDFAALVREFTDVTDPVSGGQMGLREASRYPEIFAQATLALGVGDVAALVRSQAGFHVLKVIEKSNSGLPVAAVVQSHSRHILLVPNARLSEADARKKLTDFKKQIVSGAADFAALARDNSQDGSAPQGGDLGWAAPGMFVPEFEAVLNRLAPGEIADPLVSRFGVHLIQLLERRKVSLTAEQQRESIRGMLRERKLEESYRTWASDLRGRAYVELREPPQ
jgi:peptidyl-prolyl cis-trans isomerase SurA